MNRFSTATDARTTAGPYAFCSTASRCSMLASRAIWPTVCAICSPGFTASRCQAAGRSIQRARDTVAGSVRY